MSGKTFVADVVDDAGNLVRAAGPMVPIVTYDVASSDGDATVALLMSRPGKHSVVYGSPSGPRELCHDVDRATGMSIIETFVITAVMDEAERLRERLKILDKAIAQRNLSYFKVPVKSGKKARR
jgi:hypothetical protein